MFDLFPFHSFQVSFIGFFFIFCTIIIIFKSCSFLYLQGFQVYIAVQFSHEENIEYRYQELSY